MFPIILLTLISYLLGSIPFGFITFKFLRKEDIRKFGSGNIGATNVGRLLGLKWAVTVFLLDFLKGFVPVAYVTPLIISNAGLTPYIFAALGGVCGHIWPLFLKFKGGKGVATSIGAGAVLSLIYPKLGGVLALAVIIWVIVFYSFRYVSLASLTAVFSFSLFCFLFKFPAQLKILSLLLFVLIVFRHRSNIANLLANKEKGFRRQK